MVKMLPISQHLNEENKNISKAAKCLYMFICHLQRRDSPSVVVTVRSSTNAAVAAAGHVVAIRGRGFWACGAQTRSHQISLSLTGTLAKFVQ